MGSSSGGAEPARSDSDTEGPVQRRGSNPDGDESSQADDSGTVMQLLSSVEVVFANGTSAVVAAQKYLTRAEDARREKDNEARKNIDQLRVRLSSAETELSELKKERQNLTEEFDLVKTNLEFCLASEVEKNQVLHHDLGEVQSMFHCEQQNNFLLHRDLDAQREEFAFIIRGRDDLLKRLSSHGEVKRSLEYQLAFCRKKVGQLELVISQERGEKGKAQKALEEATHAKASLENALFKETEEKFKMQQNLENVQVKKRKLEAGCVALKEAEKGRLERMQTAHRKQLEAEKAHLESIQKANEEKLEVEKARLEALHHQELEDEAQKLLCQICLAAPKDTIALPCCHLCYCGDCLDKHRQRSKTCPKCRTSLQGVLRCDISMD